MSSILKLDFKPEAVPEQAAFVRRMKLDGISSRSGTAYLESSVSVGIFSSDFNKYLLYLTVLCPYRKQNFGAGLCGAEWSPVF